MFIFAVTLVAALYFLLSRPLGQIVNQLSQLESGQTLPLNPKAYGSELNTLVSAINESVIEIDRQNVELQAVRARTTQILEEAGDACFLFDADSAKVSYANRQAADLLAMTNAELTGKAAFDIIDGLTEKEWRLRVEFVGQLPTHLREAMLVKATGDRVPVENNTTLIEVDGKPSLLVFARDIASRKRLERDFALRNVSERSASSRGASRTTFIMRFKCSGEVLKCSERMRAKAAIRMPIERPNLHSNNQAVSLDNYWRFRASKCLKKQE